MENWQIILSIVAVYCAVVIAVGVFTRSKGQSTLSDYFVGNRSLGAFVAFFTYVATFHSSFAFIGAAGIMYAAGIKFFATFTSCVVSPLMIYIIGRPTWYLGKKYNYMTQGELIGDYYESKALRYLVAVVSLVFLIPYLQSQIAAGGIIFETISGGRISYLAGCVILYAVIISYILLGGFRAVAWTDTLQGLLMIVMVWIAGGVVLLKVTGGLDWTGLMQTIAEKFPGKVLIPSSYDYAKYKNRDLVALRGNYAYPMVLNEQQVHMIYETGQSRYNADGYLHFVNRISDEDVIVISRPEVKLARYVTGCIFLGLIAFFALTTLLFTRRRKVESVFEKNYFRSRVSSVLVLSLVFTLVAMAAVSVYFVYQRSDENLSAMMSDKVNSIRALLEDACRDARSAEDLSTKEFKDVLESTSNTMKTDITLYGTDGKVFDSTTPEIFDRQLLGCRVNQVAFHNITHENKR